jgi:lactate dehydrogenase-like 2-hydroxyacid dehydrogenase
MSKPDLIVIGNFPDWDRKAMSAHFTLHLCPKTEDCQKLPSDLRDSAKYIAFIGHQAFGDDTMSVFQSLNTIANFGVGYDAIDIGAASARGIKVTNTPDVLTDDVADLALLMLLSICRDSHGAEKWVRDGNWAAKGNYPLQRKMSGARAGIVGLGRIGRAIADRLVGFDMDIAYYSRAPKQTPEGWKYFDTPQALAANVDYLIVSLSGGPATEGIVDAKTIEALGETGILLNISRGTTVDEEALIKALQERKIAGAALDVFLSEPDVDERFLTMDNVLLQPHQASATYETRKIMGKLVLDNLIAAHDGKPLLTPVN